MKNILLLSALLVFIASCGQNPTPENTPTVDTTTQSTGTTSTGTNTDSLTQSGETLAPATSTGETTTGTTISQTGTATTTTHTEVTQPVQNANASTMLKMSTENITDPAQEMAPNVFSGEDEVGTMGVHSASIGEDTLIRSITQATAFSEAQARSVLSQISSSQTYSLEGLTLFTLVNGLGATITSDDPYENTTATEPLFLITPSNALLGSKRIDDNSVIAIYKTLIENNTTQPTYLLVHLKSQNGVFTYQEAELLPWNTLYHDVSEQQMIDFTRSFDNSLREAIKNDFTFRSPNFTKRYTTLRQFFVKQEMELIRK